MLLDQNKLIPTIRDILDENTKEVVISSAYLKTDVLKELESSLRGKAVKIYVRWDIEDLIKGVSDIEVYEICKENNWRLFRNPKLHAKFILFDNETIILGSSNYTLTGTGRNRKNIERNYMTDLNYDEIHYLLRDYSHSTIIDDDIYNKLKPILETLEPSKEYEHLQFDEVIFKDPRENYTSAFSFEQLPPFRPNDNSFDPSNVYHQSFLNAHNIVSCFDYDALRTFIENNPVSTLIIDFLENENSDRCQWGTVERLIRNNENLFNTVNNDRSQLKSELGKNHRLFNLFCWLEHFNKEKYIVWKREAYLKDPREGTCSLNKTHS